ncbi:MAG: hypothetical protein IBJ09_07695 [Bacteroidia bacterium]|nr:hypothetical protein [Bacteroidia bacterium]
MLQDFPHRQHLLITAFVWSIAGSLSSFGQIGNQVDEIVTDFNGYWRSGVGNINPVLPVNSHNLLAFTYDSVRYSTGVNDAVLTANGLTFTPRIYKAIGVSAVPGTLTTNTKLGLGALYDGVNPGPSVPAPSAALSYYLMDGPQGLNLGTGIANLPVGFLSFDVNNMQAGNIGDGIPDIIITQIASPSATADKYSFRNASGQLVDNEVSINLSALNVLGNWTADFYETTPTRTLTAGFTNTSRPLRLWATDLAGFGITPGNIGSITTFRIELSGQSDVAFVAYNASALSLVPEELPGGVVKQPSLWLKANNGPGTMTNLAPVPDWADKSGKANNASQSATALRPVFLTQGLNYNPYVRFGAQYLNTFQNLTNGNGNPYSTFVVFQQENTTAKNILGSTGANCTTCVRQQLSNAAVNPALFNGTVNIFPNSPPAAGLQPWIWTSRYNGASGSTLFMNMQSSQTSTTVQTFTNRPSQIGSHSNGTPAGSSLIAEVITYPEALTNNEVQRISSYLGIKYGISISADYLSCNGSVIFESDEAGTTIVYDRRITGIGRENCQQLYQRQSKSVHAGALITLGGGGVIAATNAANTGVLPDSCYLVTGDNNGAVTWGSAPVGLPVTERIARTWRARKSGNPGAVLIRIPSSTSA